MNKACLFILLSLMIFCLAITACVSPYQGQANALTQAYQRGEISANDYNARMTDLQALDLQRRQAVAQAWQQGCQNISNNMQQQQAQRQMMLQNMQYNRPTSTYGTIYTPTGRMYQYNSTTY